MAVCQNCGTQFDDGLAACPNCGAAGTVQPAQQPFSQPVGQPVQAAVVDSGSIGWGILGFLIPIVGLVLFLVWKNNKPNSAKVAGIGAIAGFIFGLVVNIASAMFLGQPTTM